MSMIGTPWKRVGAALVVVLAGAAGMQAAPTKERGDRRREAIEQRLGLSPEQGQRWEQLRAARREAARAQRQELRRQRGELRELLEAETLDERAVQAKTRQVAELHANLARQHAEHRLALRRMLTAEQLAAWKALREEGRERRAQRRERLRQHRRWRGERDVQDGAAGGGR